MTAAVTHALHHPSPLAPAAIAVSIPQSIPVSSAPQPLSSAATFEAGIHMHLVPQQQQHQQQQRSPNADFHRPPPQLAPPHAQPRQQHASHPQQPFQQQRLQQPHVCQHQKTALSVPVAAAAPPSPAVAVPASSVTPLSRLTAASTSPSSPAAVAKQAANLQSQIQLQQTKNSQKNQKGRYSLMKNAVNVPLTLNGVTLCIPENKTPMCLINELARYNKTTHQYKVNLTARQD